MPSLKMTTRALLLGLPFAFAACTYSPGYISGKPAPQTFDLVDSSSQNTTDEFYLRPDIRSTRSGMSYNFQTAADREFTDQPFAYDSSRVSLIGLYGETATNTWASSDPFDGGRNLTQVSFADEGACFDPDIDRSGSWIVFASTRHRDTSDLYIKSTSGKTITQITSDPADDLMPAFDPTGKRVVFASNRTGNWNIYAKSIESGPAMQVTSSREDELHPTWSPDGRHIAYCKLGAQSGRWEIWVVDVANPGNASFLDYGLFPQWCPDIAHSKILFQRSRQRGSRYHSIWTIDFVNGEAMYPTEIASAANAAVINPTWSTDGRRIAFVTVVEPDEDGMGSPAQSDVWIINLDGSNRTMLTNGQFANFQPVWAPNGTMYYVSNRSGVENIWAVSAPRNDYMNSYDTDLVNVDTETVGPPYQP